jgi:hypothetical protein
MLSSWACSGGWHGNKNKSKSARVNITTFHGEAYLEIVQTELNLHNHGYISDVTFHFP